MSWRLSEKEKTSVLVADARHRYEYFIHRVCETRAVWALFNDGWASVADDAGKPMLPLWPHQAYASAFATGAWLGFEPRKILLDEFLGSWIPGLRQEGMVPAVFPVPTGSSVIVTLDDLEAHLRHELDAVYGVEDV